MEDQVCPRCRTTKYRNPSLKLLVNVCGHSLCESCVDLLFLKGSGSCPDCGIPLRRSNFRVQLFEDAGIEKEVDIRRRVLKDYNKKEEDFPTLEKYNAYLEEIEDIIYNLAHGIATVETNRRIEQYKKENKDSIVRNKGKVGRGEMELEELLEMERRSEQRLRAETEREEVEAKRRKIRTKEALIDELMFSEANANGIVKSFAKKELEGDEGLRDENKVPEKAFQFSTGIRFGTVGGDSCTLIPPLREEGPLFVYNAPEMILDGPELPNPTDAHLGHMRPETTDEKAGGFHSRVACLRALQEAVAGLYYSVRNS